MKVGYQRVTSLCLSAAAALFVVLGLVHGAVLVVATFSVCFGVMDLMLPGCVGHVPESWRQLRRHRDRGHEYSG